MLLFKSDTRRNTHTSSTFQVGVSGQTLISGGFPKHPKHTPPLPAYSRLAAAAIALVVFPLIVWLRIDKSSASSGSNLPELLLTQTQAVRPSKHPSGVEPEPGHTKNEPAQEREHEVSATGERAQEREHRGSATGEPTQEREHQESATQEDSFSKFPTLEAAVLRNKVPGIGDSWDPSGVPSVETQGTLELVGNGDSWDPWDPSRVPIAVEIPDGTLYLPQVPEAVAGPGKRRPRRVVFNYGRGCCEKAQARNCKTAISFGADMCIAFRERALSAEFKERNKGILEQARGGGYWLWKPYLALKVMRMLDEGDMVMLSDSDQDFEREVKPLFDFMAANEHSVLIGIQADPFHGYGNQNRAWTRRDTFLLVGCTDEARCADTWQLQASTVGFQKTEGGLAVAAKWMAYMQDPRATTDMDDVLGQKAHPGFMPQHTPIEHRHDQSVLSLIAVKHNITALHAMCCNGLEFNTVNHHRRKDLR